MPLANLRVLGTMDFKDLCGLFAVLCYFYCIAGIRRRVTMILLRRNSNPNLKCVGVLQTGSSEDLSPTELFVIFRKKSYFNATWVTIISHECRVI